MSDFNYAAARISAAQICRAAGMERSVPSALEVITDILLQELELLGKSAVSAAENRGSESVDMDDIMLAMCQCGVINSKVDFNDLEYGAIADVLEMLRWLQGPDQLRQSLVARPTRSLPPMMPYGMPHMPPGPPNGVPPDFMNAQMPPNIPMPPGTMPNMGMVPHMGMIPNMGMTPNMPNMPNFPFGAGPNMMQMMPQGAPMMQNPPPLMPNVMPSMVPPGVPNPPQQQPHEPSQQQIDMEGNKEEEDRSNTEKNTEGNENDLSGDTKDQHPEKSVEMDEEVGTQKEAPTDQKASQDTSVPPGPSAQNQMTPMPPMPIQSASQFMPFMPPMEAEPVERDWLKSATNRQVLMGHRDWFVNTKLGDKMEPDTVIHGKS